MYKLYLNYQLGTYSIFQNQGTPSCLGAASSCLVWPRLALPGLALPCLVMPCLVLPGFECDAFLSNIKKWDLYGDVVLMHLLLHLQSD